MEQRKRMKVLCPVENEKTKRTFWMNVGVAFENRDGSTNIYLDLLPTNGKLHLREYDERDDRSPLRSGAADATAGESLPF